MCCVKNQSWHLLLPHPQFWTMWCGKQQHNSSPNISADSLLVTYLCANLLAAPCCSLWWLGQQAWEQAVGFGMVKRLIWWCSLNEKEHLPSSFQDIIIRALMMGTHPFARYARSTKSYFTSWSHYHNHQQGL